MIPAYFDLAEHWSGTMFEPVALDFEYDAEDAEVVAETKEVGDPFELAGAYARMTCRDAARNVVFDWFTADHPDSANAYLAVDADVPGRFWITGPGVLTVTSFGKFAFDLKIWIGGTEPWKWLQGMVPLKQGQTS